MCNVIDAGGSSMRNGVDDAAVLRLKGAVFSLCALSAVEVHPKPLELLK